MSQEVKLITNSENETKRLAKVLAQFLKIGDIISLTGDLGAGKTIFTKGLATGLDIGETITSPTFTIIKEYEGRLPLYHFDVFRLLSPSELAPLGYEEYFYGDGIVVIEWGDKIKALLPKDFLTIEFHRAIDNEARRDLIVKANGQRSEELLNQWMAKICS